MGGQGHTCVHYTGLCVSPQSGVEWGTKVKHIKNNERKKKSADVVDSETQSTFLGAVVGVFVWVFL